MTWTTFAPLRHLLDTLREITRTGRFEARVPSDGGRDVLSELAHVSNQMLERIQTLVGGMRGALDSVAHDLRTPIARLRSRAETALLTDGDEHACREALADVVEESDRVSSLLTTLMDISEAETGVMQLRPTPVDVAEVVRGNPRPLRGCRGAEADHADVCGPQRPHRQRRPSEAAPGARQSRRQRREVHAVRWPRHDQRRADRAT